MGCTASTPVDVTPREKDGGNHDASTIPEQSPVPDGKDGHHHNDQQYPSDIPYDEVEQGMMTSNTKKESHVDDKTGKCITSFIAEDASESETEDSDAGDKKIREVKAKKKESKPVAVAAKETTDKESDGPADITMVEEVCDGETQDSPPTSNEEDIPATAEMNDLD